MDKSKCKFCGRKGLLIYPVRYAVACPAGAAGIPGLSGNFKINAAPPEIASAKYVLRALRAGYLYTYDEKRKILKAYVATPKGYLWNFPIEYLAPQAENIRFSCTEQIDISLAHCIDITHSDNDPAGNLWMGWSNVLWTKDLINKIDDTAWRKLHMHCINIPAMLAGGAAHTGEFQATSAQVAHFAADKAAMVKAFAFSNTPPQEEISQHGLNQHIGKAMAALEPNRKGFIVAVNDPVGITNDLSELTIPTQHAGFDEIMYRGKMVSDLINNTEQQVRGAARDEIALDAEISQQNKENPDGDGHNSVKHLYKIVKAGGIGRYEAQKAREKKKYGDDLAGHQTAAADLAWEELTSIDGKPVLDKKRLAEFPPLYDAAIAKFTPVYDRLARAHDAWLSSEQLANWMDGVHDPCDLRSGYAYSESMSQCIGKAVSSEHCIGQLKRWLNSGDLTNTRNLYGRALLFNQKSLISAVQPQLKGSDIQIENILNIYKGAFDRLDSGSASKLFDRLALTTANIFIFSLKKTASKSMHALSLIHLCILGDCAINLTGKSPGEFSKWIREEAKLLGIPLTTNSKDTKTAAYNTAKKLINTKVADPSIIGYEIIPARLLNDKKISENLFRTIKIPGFESSRKWLGSTTPRFFHLGVVTAILQIIALSFATQDLVNNDRFNEWETRTKLFTAIISLSSTIIDTVATTVEKSTSHPIAAYFRTQWAVDTASAAKFANRARVIGAAAGVIASCYDIAFNATNAFSDGDKTLGWLYVTNGLLGIAIAIAAYCTATIFWPLLITSFIVGIAIAYVNRSAIQQWFSRCYFNNSSSENLKNNESKIFPYLTLEEEMKAYDSAIGSL